MNPCGTTTSIYVEVDANKAKRVYKVIFETLKYYQEHYCDIKLINGQKNKQLYSFNNTYMTNSKVVELYTDQYFNQINKKTPYIYTVDDMKKSVSKITQPLIKKMMNKIFDVSKSLTTYQYKNKEVLN